MEIFRFAGKSRAVRKGWGDHEGKRVLNSAAKLVDASLVATTAKTAQGTHTYDVWLTDAEIVLVLDAALQRVGREKRSARLARTIGDLVRCFLLGS